MKTRFCTEFLMPDLDVQLDAGYPQNLYDMKESPTRSRYLPRQANDIKFSQKCHMHFLLNHANFFPLLILSSPHEDFLINFFLDLSWNYWFSDFYGGYEF